MKWMRVEHPPEGFQTKEDYALYVLGYPSPNGLVSYAELYDRHMSTQ